MKRILNSVLALGLFASPALSDTYNVPTDLTLQEAVDEAAASGDPESIIHLQTERLLHHGEIAIVGAFDNEHRLVIKPDPEISVLRRVTLASDNGAEPILRIQDAGGITLQDLDLIRHITNQTNLLEIIRGTNIVVQRCRVGSDWTTTGFAGHANLRIVDAEQTVVRNCLFFAYAAGTFDSGIRVETQTAHNNSVWLYNNTVSDHRSSGIDITADGDSFLLLRNNVVVNRAGLDPEPFAYRSNVDPFVGIVTSHNAAFAATANTESVVGAQSIAGTEAFLNLPIVAAPLAFFQTVWIIAPEWDANLAFNRLRDPGPLHNVPVDAGILVEDGAPHVRDVAVLDDWEQDLRPLSETERTDRGADQIPFMKNLALVLPRIPSFVGASSGSPGSEAYWLVPVGPLNDLPELPPAMSGGEYGLRGRFPSLLAPQTMGVAPDIAITPAGLYFGLQALGVPSAPQRVKVQNVGSANLHVYSLTSSNSEFVATTGTSLAAMVAPGGSFTFEVQFTPAALGSRNGTITIASDDPDQPARPVACGGTGAAPRIAVNPPSLAFGNVPVGTTVRRDLMFKNEGNWTLMISNVSGSNPVFRVEASQVFPLALAPGQEWTVPVDYTPVGVGQDFDRIEITSDDPASPVILLEMTGIGVELPDCSDAGRLPLRVQVSGGGGWIWNEEVLNGQEVSFVWNYEGVPYTNVAISGTNNFSVNLETNLCTTHFIIYHTEQGASAVPHDDAVELARLLEEGWTALNNQGFRDPADLQSAGRYTVFGKEPAPPFRRVPVLIYTYPGVGTVSSSASDYPFIRLNIGLLPTHPYGPIHELFHVIYHGYATNNPPWLHEGLATWAEQFTSDHAHRRCDPQDFMGFLPLHHNFLTRRYCDTAPWFHYLGTKYSAEPSRDGADVIRVFMEQMGEVLDGDLNGTMLAFERALNQYDDTREDSRSGYGYAFAEWTGGNYVADTNNPPHHMRANAPLYPRFKEGGIVAPGGTRYLFREYTFVLSRTDTTTILVRASAGANDDLRILLDGEVLGDWDSTNSFNGEALQGRLLTLRLARPSVPAGSHTIRLEADGQPVFYSLAVFEGDVPLLLPSPSEVTLDGPPYPAYELGVTADTRNVTLLLTGEAQVGEDAQIYRNGIGQGGPNETLSGDDLQGALATTEVHWTNLAIGTHNLEIRGAGQPRIRDIVAFATPPQPPLLQVRTIGLGPWSADYRVVPVTQALIDSGDDLQVELETIEWSMPDYPPIIEGMSLDTSNTLISGTRRPQAALHNSWHYLGPIFPAFFGADGRIVHVTTATLGSGTCEWVATRVPDANDPPVLAAIPDQIAQEGQELRLTVSASDPDVPANRLSYTLALGAPSGAGIDSRTGEFTWTPSETQGPGVYDLTVRVTDDGAPSLSDSATFRITVTEANQPPHVNPLINHDVQEGEAVSFVVVATDPDRPMNALTFSLDPGAPGGMIIGPNNGWLQWVPQEFQGPGTYPVTVRVTDNGVPPLSGTGSFTVEVREVNTAPVLADIADLTVYVGDDVRIAPAATDWDVPANALSWQLTAGPGEATVDPLTGVFRWVPGISGAQMFTLQVSDNGSPSLSDTENFLVTAVAGPEITAVSVNGNQVRVTFTSLPGRVYRLQYTRDLENPDWTDASEDVLAAAQETTVEVVVRAASQEFYRVSVVR